MMELIDLLDIVRRATTGSDISNASCSRFMVHKMLRGWVCTHHAAWEVLSCLDALVLVHNPYYPGVSPWGLMGALL